MGFPPREIRPRGYARRVATVPLSAPSPSFLPPGDEPGTNVAKASSTAIAGLHQRFFGRGPGSVRALWDTDMLVVTLRGGGIPLERTRTDAGDEKVVSDVLPSLQKVMQPHDETVVRAGAAPVPRARRASSSASAVG